jgi:hypothetical protein
LAGLEEKNIYPDGRNVARMQQSRHRSRVPEQPDSAVAHEPTTGSIRAPSARCRPLSGNCATRTTRRSC